MADKYLTIKSASDKYGLSPVYIRRAIRVKDLESKLVPIAKGSKTKEHRFSVTAFKAWRASRSSRSHRDDGRNKMTIYVNLETELEVIKAAISKALPEFDVDALIMRANPAKSK